MSVPSRSAGTGPGAGWPDVFPVRGFAHGVVAARLIGLDSRKNVVELTHKERLRRQALGQEVDRIPSLGGWMMGVRNLATIAGISIEEYLADPLAGVVRANVALEVDGMVTPVIPMTIDQVRSGSVQEEQYQGVEPEVLLKEAESLPDDARTVLANFNAREEETRFRRDFDEARARWAGIEPIPNYWDFGGPFPLYHQYGYVAFLSACALYPEAVGKIWWARSRAACERAKILARLYRELDLVPLLFCGEDLCNNQGPMVDPAMLRKYYFPLVKEILEPLVNSGVRIVHHCDGDVRPLVDDFIAIGFSGLQGFQYELGIDLADFRRRRGPHGEELILFTGLSVTRTLPFGTEDDAREEVDFFLDVTEGGRGMFLFTSNVTGVEVPPANLIAAYRHVKTWDPRQPCHTMRRQWPWGVKHGS